MIEPNYVEIISSLLNLRKVQVINTFKLVDEENTAVFIARYRKEMTGNLDEDVIRKIVEVREKEVKIYSAKVSALENIEKQGKLTPELERNIENAKTRQEVEDLYKPFKLKKKTKAMIAKEKGFDVVAGQIRNQEKIVIPSNLLDKFSEEDIVSGACDIVSQEIADDVKLRDMVRVFYKRHGVVLSSYKTKKSLDGLSPKAKEQVYKFEIYDDFEGDVSRIKAYQVLALNRGENLKILNVKLDNDDACLELLEGEIVVKGVNVEPLKSCVKDGYKKIFSSIETEVRGMLTEKAEAEAIVTFQKNLKKLLMTKPQYGKKVLAIDPGFRTGCKVAVLDDIGNPQEFSKFYLEKETDSIRVLKEILNKYEFDVVALGNGTASNETLEFLRKNFELPVVIVNESGASVYSASSAAKEEFPKLDLTDRGTVSIGRRFVDPLAELVKIPALSIGVGMYQHDMNQNELATKLSYVVEDVVNLVGINVNTSSVYLLKEVSGLDLRSAKKVFKGRPYFSREALKKVLSDKIYEQAAGFLRVPDSKEKFDNTSIHPEQYAVAKFIIDNKITDYAGSEGKLKQIYSLMNKETFEDILKAYREMGSDPRKYEASLRLDKVLVFEDLKVGDELSGVVRNILQFGAFVDVGLKNDGLVHISELADKFVKDPHDIVSVGEDVRVKVIGIDAQRQKVQLSMKQVES